MPKVEIEQVELDELKARLAKLEKASEPPEPFKREPVQPWDPTANFGMPRSAVQAMAAAVPDALLADLKADALKPNPVTQSGSSQLSQVGERVQIQRGSGWQEPNPLRSPADTAHCRMARSAREKGE
jgi:hypothetical protein